MYILFVKKTNLIFLALGEAGTGAAPRTPGVPLPFVALVFLKKDFSIPPLLPPPPPPSSLLELSKLSIKTVSSISPPPVAIFLYCSTVVNAPVKVMQILVDKGSSALVREKLIHSSSNLNV